MTKIWLCDANIPIVHTYVHIYQSMTILQVHTKNMGNKENNDNKR
jgi:hypothetical protein